MTTDFKIEFKREKIKHMSDTKISFIINQNSSFLLLITEIVASNSVFIKCIFSSLYNSLYFIIKEMSKSKNDC